MIVIFQKFQDIPNNVFLLLRVATHIFLESVTMHRTLKTKSTVCLLLLPMTVKIVPCSYFLLQTLLPCQMLLKTQ